MARQLKTFVLKLSMLVMLLMFSTHVTANAAYSITPSSVTLKVGQTSQLMVNGKRTSGKWKSSNKKVVSVNKKGTLAAVRPGSAVITFAKGKETAACNVTVAPISLSATSASVGKGNSYQLVVNNAGGKVKWSTNKKKVATVSKTGVVVGKKEGAATITAKIGGVKLTCRVTVTKPVRPTVEYDANDFELNESYSLTVGGTYRIAGVTGLTSSTPSVAQVRGTDTVVTTRIGATRLTGTIISTGAPFVTYVTVVENVLYGFDYYSIDLDDYDWNDIAVEALKTYYSGDSLVMDAVIINNSPYRVTKINYLTMNVTAEGRTIASYKFKNIKVNIKPYDIVKKTLKFPAKSTYDKNVDLADLDFDEDFDYPYRYYYTYSYR